MTDTLKAPRLLSINETHFTTSISIMMYLFYKCVVITDFIKCLKHIKELGMYTTFEKSYTSLDFFSGKLELKLQFSAPFYITFCTKFACFQCSTF